MTPHEKMEQKFKMYSIEWVDTELEIENLELNGEPVPDELYEKRYVLWDNIDVILKESVRLGYVQE
jgi:hypothetical protein